ncbi:MAG: hypothetical protein ACRDH2_13055, partial [Anaerolineales bacterium]
MDAGDLSFVPSPDVAAILHVLLDVYERRPPLPSGRPKDGPGVRVSQRAIRYNFDAFGLPTYFSQTDPAPRRITNDQLHALERAGVVKL